jgi:DNA-binding winged helix-turn-helix (wHTH) protein
MALSKLKAADRRRGRRWVFGACVFDESNWSLTVDGRRVAVETKPLELLRELLLSAGLVLSKDELLDQIWPDVTVVEASLPTAVRKLRMALGDDRRADSIIETVQGIGYRLAVPVAMEEFTDLRRAAITEGHSAADHEPHCTPQAASSGAPTSWRLSRLIPITAGVGILAVAALAAVAPPPHAAPPTTKAAAPITQRDAANALRKLDVGTIEKMLAAGWNPNTPFDNQGNGAINYVLNICEWDREQDQQEMVLMVRTLIDGGAKLDQRNVWGDTPYSIAKAVRYCGPNHLVTRSIRAMCFSGYKPYGDRCLASYELERRNGQGNSVG